MSILEKAISAATPTTRETVLSIDEAAEILSVERRRLVLKELDREESIRLSDLSERVSTIRYGPDWDGADRKREYVPLYQDHLPKLDDHDIVRWDSDRGIVRRGPEFDAALETLEAVEEVVA